MVGFVSEILRLKLSEQLIFREVFVPVGWWYSTRGWNLFAWTKLLVESLGFRFKLCARWMCS